VKVYVSSSNKNFTQEILEAKTRFLGKKPSKVKKEEATKLVYILHHRIIGVCKRGGGLAIKMLPPKLVPKGGRPPVESAEEIKQSGLLRRIPRRGKHVLHTDGAASWPKAIRELGLTGVLSRQCNHTMKKFSHPVETPPKHSKLSGTMSVDGRWKSAQDFVPKQLAGKKDGNVNPGVERYVWSWLWRHNLADRKKLMEELGKLCKVEGMRKQGR
jgi:hypothetical protein